MKKLLLCLVLALCATTLSAQNFPYGKYLNFSKAEFKQNHFKYDSEFNTWRLAKQDGLRATANVLSAISGSVDDIRPDKNDYEIMVQMSAEDEIATIKVVFHNEETLHQILTYIADHGTNQLETKGNNTIKTQFEADGYSLQLEQIHRSRQSVSNFTYQKAKVVDDSYNIYIYTIFTDKEPWSEAIAKKQFKEAKRDAKGKKKRNVSDLM